jgi:exodeoxyribonuclease VII small subunit
VTAGDPDNDDLDLSQVGEIGYAAAVDELEAILAVLERDDLDIDILGPQVKRAAELIRVCRDRIAAARHDVEQIVADLGEVVAPRDDRHPDDGGDDEATHPDTEPNGGEADADRTSYD